MAEADLYDDPELARLQALEDATVWSRYYAAFGAMPPMIYWHGGDTRLLERVMEQAIKDGKPLTSIDLLNAQGMAPAPPGALV